MVNYRRLGVALIHYGFLSPFVALIMVSSLIPSGQGTLGAQGIVLVGLTVGALIAYLFRQAMAKSQPYALKREIGLIVLASLGMTSLMGVVGLAFYIASDDSIPLKNGVNNRDGAA